MVAKSIAKIYTNIHKPTDYNVMLDIFVQVEQEACLSQLAKLQDAILARSSRDVSNCSYRLRASSSHEYASQFGLEMFYTRKTPKTFASFS